jgi:hypothetical protein
MTYRKLLAAALDLRTEDCGKLVLIVIGFLCGCHSATRDHPKHPAEKQQKGAEAKPMDEPFMEHPTGDFESAVDAMADAIERLRALPKRDEWITFNAQGMGDRGDSYHFAEIRMRQGEIAFENPLDVDIQKVTKQAGVPESCLSKTEGGYSVATATPIQAARVMDVIFRHYLGIRPHTGEENDYAVGAEW